MRAPRIVVCPGDILAVSVLVVMVATVACVIGVGACVKVVPRRVGAPLEPSRV